MVLNFDTYSMSILVSDATYVIFGIIKMTRFFSSKNSLFFQILKVVFLY